MDRIGILGVMLVALGAAITMAMQSSMPLWARWLVGPLLWYSGFAFLLAWALLRAFPLTRIASEEEEEEALPEAKPQKIGLVWSNFLEHGQDNIA